MRRYAILAVGPVFAVKAVFAICPVFAVEAILAICPVFAVEAILAICPVFAHNMASIYNITVCAFDDKIAGFIYICSLNSHAIYAICPVFAVEAILAICPVFAVEAILAICPVFAHNMASIYNITVCAFDDKIAGFIYICSLNSHAIYAILTVFSLDIASVNRTAVAQCIQQMTILINLNTCDCLCRISNRTCRKHK